ncbi:S24 family peptidase [Enterococcus faecalis]|uniref:S24 family peptidase n=1 Tax=Enterococcus faecalis TaxID=1351 RepID=UPI003D13BE16
MDNIIGTQIMLLRKRFGLTQEDLALKLGYSKQTISNWETGLKTPRMGAIQKISDLFNVSKSFIIEGDQPTTTLTEITDISAKLEEKRQVTVLNVAKKELSEQQLDTQQKVTSLEQHRQKRQQQQELGDIDWCGAVSAGTGEFLGDENREKINLPIEMIPDGADFCLSVNGNSMEPVFKNDSYVFVEKQTDLYSGAIGVVIVNSQAFLKRIWFENNHARLESFNKEYEDIIVTEDDDFRIVGKVVM